MPQTLVRIVYSAVTCQPRRVIVPDDDAQLAIHSEGPGEAALDVTAEDYAVLQTGDGVPDPDAVGRFISDRLGRPLLFAIVLNGGNEVVSILTIDPACGDTLGAGYDGCSIMQHPAPLPPVGYIRDGDGFSPPPAAPDNPDRHWGS